MAFRLTKYAARLIEEDTRRKFVPLWACIVVNSSFLNFGIFFFVSMWAFNTGERIGQADAKLQDFVLVNGTTYYQVSEAMFHFMKTYEILTFFLFGTAFVVGIYYGVLIAMQRDVRNGSGPGWRRPKSWLGRSG